MSKLEELIYKFCPDGVEFIRLGEVLDYEQATNALLKATDS